jgi:dTDP-glucose 4,6-dehydratase/UDP-glucuronate decarboxylase
MDANAGATRSLLEFACRSKIKSMLYFSSSEIYGDPPADQIPTKEEYRGNVSCTGPRACYDESKRYGETLCVNFWKASGVPVKTVRPFNVYGPGMKIDDRRVIPDFFRDAFDGRDIVLLSDGRATRSFSYVSDAADGFMKVLLSDFSGEAFNVGNDREEITMVTLANEVRALFGNKISVVFKTSDDKNYLTDNPVRRCPDLGKIRRLLGYEPKVMIREGLGRMKDWYMQNR